MNQGQIGWLESRENVEGNEGFSSWVIKLRSNNNCTSFFSLKGERIIAHNLVDDSMENKHPDRPFMITLVVSPEEQLKTMGLRSDLFDDIKVRATEEELDRKIKNLEEKISFNNSLIKDLTEKISSYSEENKKTFSLVSELKTAVSVCYAGKSPLFYYAYGKHTPEGAEYCWRIPDRLISSVHPGDEILVETATGIKSCTVTRIQKMPYYLSKHKLVVDIVKNSKCD